MSGISEALAAAVAIAALWCVIDAKVAARAAWSSLDDRHDDGSFGAYIAERRRRR